MKTLTLELPDALMTELDASVEAGWFENHVETVRAAVQQAVRRHRLIPHESRLLSDIEPCVNNVRNSA